MISQELSPSREQVSSSAAETRLSAATSGELSTVAAVAAILGQGAVPAGTLEGLRAEVTALRDPTTKTALEVLGRQTVVMEALATRFAVEASRTKNPDAALKFMKAVVLAQSALGRSLALTAGLQRQAEGSARVVVDSYPDSDGLS